MGWLEQLRIGLEERALSGMRRAAFRRTGPESQPAHLATGEDGELAALFHLRRNGYSVVARRWSSGDLPGDIDLIAWRGPVLCFVEVKARTALDASPAEIAVDSHKRSTLRRLARRYVRQLPRQQPPPVRFDILSVYLVPGNPREFVHFEAAFGWSERRERAWE
jgi:putative endonuclease